MTTHARNLLVTTGLGLVLIGTLALWPVPRDAVSPAAQTAAPSAAEHVAPPTAGSVASVASATAGLGAVTDRYADCQVLDEQTGPADATGRYERVRVVRTTEKYPLVRVVEKRVQGSGVRVQESAVGDQRAEVRGQEESGGLSPDSGFLNPEPRNLNPQSDTLLSQTAMVADHVLVQVKEGTTEAQLAAFAKANGGTILRKLRVPGPGTYLVKMASVTVDTVPQAIAALGQAAGPAEAVHPDGLVYTCDTFPNDPRFAELWGMHNVSAASTAIPGLAMVYVAGRNSDASRLGYSPITPPEGVSGLLYNCGLGKAGEFPAGVSGNIALIRRGDNTFAEKATNAKAAGAVAAVIYNDVAGGFAGTLGEAGDWLPTVGISDVDGAQLLSLVNTLAVVMTFSSNADIDAPAAWDLNTGSRDVLVGVIDTGIDYTHEDLAANMWSNPGENGLDAAGNDKRTNGIDDDGNGFVDDWHGWDFANDDNDPMDDHFHGTHCAGTIGGVGNNGIGVAGVCWNVSLVGLKFIGPQGSGAISDATEAIYYATGIGVRLTSNSWGGGGSSANKSDPTDPQRRAILDAGAHGILFVVAAGNSAWNNDDPNLTFFPSSYDCENLISVAATDSGDSLAAFSDYGATTVDLGAPGVGILSSTPQNTYRLLNGTSMATPHVAGACALIAAAVPDWTAAQIKEQLLGNTDPIPALAGKCVTGGRLNIGRAIVSPTPMARLAGSEIADAAPGGNGDGLFNPGETLAVTVQVRNCSMTPLTNVNLTLTSADPYVTVVDGAAAGGDLPGLRTQLARDTFTVAVAPNCPTPREVTLAVAIVAGNGGPWAGTVRFTVYTSSQISGRVTLDGVPVAGVTIDYIGPMRGTRVTDANGAYLFGALDGLHFVSARKTDWLATAAAKVTVPPSTGSVDFAFTTATVSGRVTDGVTGEPVVGATVAYACAAALTGSATTDADGRYSFTRVYGRAATLTLTASHPAYFDATNSVTVPPDAVGVDFAMGRPEIEVDRTPIEVTATMGEVVTRSLTIGDRGLVDLDWQINPPGHELRRIEDVYLNTEPLAFDGAVLWSGLFRMDALSGAWLGPLTVPDDCDPMIVDRNGLDWDGANLWLVHGRFALDPKFATIHTVNPLTGAIGKTLRLPGVYLPQGLTVGGGGVWVLGRLADFSRRVWKLDASTGAVLAEWPLPAELGGGAINWWFEPYEIEFLNGALWTCRDGAEGLARMYKLHPDTGQVLESFPIPGGHTYGLARAGSRSLWLASSHEEGMYWWVMPHLIELGDEPWMRESPRSGSVPACGTQTVELTLDTVAAGLGVHESVYRIASNDPDDPDLEIPVRFTVLPNPANHAPVIAEGASVGVTLSEEGTPTPFALTLHATDADGEALAWSVVAPAAHGSALAMATGGTAAVDYLPDADYFGADSFLVQVSDARGGTAEIAVNVTVQNVNDAPTLTATANPTMGAVPLTVNFTATAADPDGDALTYLWDFGDGQTSYSSHPSYTYINAGTYTITVTVTDPDGCSARTPLLVSATAGAARGLVYAWGWNGRGQLGNGTTTDSTVPIQVPGLLAANVMAGGGHSTAILPDGSIFNWGSSSFGTLGAGDFVNRPTPQPAPALAGGTAVFGDGSQSFVLKSGGTVWGCGLNNRGQLGDGTTTDRCSPVQMLQTDGSPFTGVVAVAASGNHTLLLKADGTVWGTGADYSGQLGNGSTTGDPTVHPVQATLQNGSPLTGITAIGLAQDTSYAIGGTDRRVWGWGYNWYGEVGGNSGDQTVTRALPVVCEDGSPLTGIVTVDGGFHHAAALRDDGAVWNWGDGSKGQLGEGRPNVIGHAVPALISNVTAIAAGSYYTMAIKADRSLWSWGNCPWGGSGWGSDVVYSPRQLTGLAQVTTVSANMAHTLAIVDESANAVIADATFVTVPEGGTAAFRVKLAMAPSRAVTVTVRRASGDTDLTVHTGDELSFNLANWDSWQTVTLAAAEDVYDADDGAAAFVCDAPDMNSAGVMAREADKDAWLEVRAAPGGTTTPTRWLVAPKNVLLQITATPDAGGSFVKWTALAGAVTFGDANAASTTVTIVGDSGIRADFTTAANRAPVITTPAWVGPNPAALIAGATVHVGASDPDGDMLSYAWSQVSGPGAAAFGTPSAANGGVTFGAAGTYVLRVTVDDNRGGTVTSDVTVTVNAPGNNPPTIVSAAWADTNPVTLPAGTTLHVVAADPDGDALTYAWTKVSGAGTATFAAPAATASGVSFNAAGSYVLRVTVADGKGGSVSSDVSITVNPGSGADPRADVNHDGVINALDLQIIIANFGKTVGSPGCDARADANADAVVNALDLQIVIANFGQVVP